ARELRGVEDPERPAHRAPPSLRRARRATRNPRVRSRSRDHARGAPLPSSNSVTWAAVVEERPVHRAIAQGSSARWEIAFLTAAAELKPACITTDRTRPS